MTFWKPRVARASDTLTPPLSQPSDLASASEDTQQPVHASTGGRVRDMIHLACRLLVGGVFVVAGATKIFDYQAMLLAVDAYELLPAGLVGPVAVALPWVEVAVGVALLAGYALRAAAGTAGVLLVGFLIALGQAKARGLAIDCGCFGAGGPGEGVSWWAIARDLPLLAAAGWLWQRPDGPLSLDAVLARRHFAERHFAEREEHS